MREKSWKTILCTSVGQSQAEMKRCTGLKVVIKKQKDKCNLKPLSFRFTPVLNGVLLFSLLSYIQLQPKVNSIITLITCNVDRPACVQIIQDQRKATRCTLGKCSPRKYSTQQTNLAFADSVKGVNGNIT